jgi:hypothetical protein
MTALVAWQLLAGLTPIMRRVLTFLTAAVLLLASLCIGVFTADLPFWRRAIDLPLEANEAYVPTVRIGDGSFGVSMPSGTALDRARIAAVVDRARAAGADALLVAQHGQLELERYFAADKENFSLYSADFLARPLAALAVGFARKEGRIDSLDTAVSRWLPEWEGEARGRITLRQLLNETSGLETGVDASDVLVASPFDTLSRLPAFATSRGVRLVLGNDYEATALGFGLEHEPGGFFNVSPVNAQLAAIIVERVGSKRACSRVRRSPPSNCRWTGAAACPRRIAACAPPPATRCSSPNWSARVGAGRCRPTGSRRCARARARTPSSACRSSG